MQLPVSVDWSAWPAALANPKIPLANLLIEWQQEFAANIQPIVESLPMLSPAPVDPLVTGSPWEPFADTWDWTDLDQELLEDFHRHERHLNDNYRP